MVTDGIADACSPDQDLFDNERALQVVRDHGSRPAQEILERLYHAIWEFTGGKRPDDDVTAIVIKVGSLPR